MPDKNEFQTLADKLREEKLTIAFAESMTAGLLVNEFSKLKEISSVLKGSLVTYNRELKENLLNVSPAIIDEFSAESQEVTTAMVLGLLKKINSDICVAVTGLASPGGSESPHKPVGTVFVSLIFKGKLYEYREYFPPDPSDSIDDNINIVMNRTVRFIFYKLLEIHKEQKKL